EFGPIKRPQYYAPANQSIREEITIRPPKDSAVIVDGYNIIFAWEELAALAKEDLDSACRRLMDILSSYAGFRKCRLILVFDGHKAKGNLGRKTHVNNLQVVYTKENETADHYIEKFVVENVKKYRITVATSDGLEQMLIFGQGALRMPARELRERVISANREMREKYLGK
ncbi:MAG: NYN domain-containing protein, partial [Firmicutes bacterium]|nr:NYN domain-containing protein [Bacillota bacterium]